MILKEDAGRVRAGRGSRKPLPGKYPELLPTIESIIQDGTNGSHEDPLHWTTLGSEKISDQLKERGIPAGKQGVTRALDKLQPPAESEASAGREGA